MYRWLTTFGAGKPWEEFSCDEYDTLLMIDRAFDAEAKRKRKIAEAQARAKQHRRR